MALWFSATAVIPALANEWHLTDTGKSWLAVSVQVGVVTGAFLSALFNARKLFTLCAFAGVAFNAAIGLFLTGIEPALVLRFLTGVCLAGVYLPGMKIMASWFKERRGMAIGVLVGALTVSSASPHLLYVIGSPNWRELMLFASISSVLAGILSFLFMHNGPYQAPTARFGWRYVNRALSNQGNGWRTSATSDTCGSCTRCGHGFRYPFLQAFKQVDSCLRTHGMQSERSVSSVWEVSVAGDRSFSRRVGNVEIEAVARGGEDWWGETFTTFVCMKQPWSLTSASTGRSVQELFQTSVGQEQSVDGRKGKGISV